MSRSVDGVAASHRGSILVIDDDVMIDGFVYRDAEVATFLSDIGEDQLGHIVGQALSLGVVGLKAVGVAGQIDIVEREFLKLNAGFVEALSQTERELMERVDLTFDPSRAESVSARLGSMIQAAERSAAEVIDSAREQLGELMGEAFNPDLTTSSVHRIMKLVIDTRSELERSFDPAYEGSYLARLQGEIDDYFGDDGAICQVVETKLAPVKKELLDAIQGLRDVIISNASASQVRRLSSASGDDFEDEVEDVLRRVAKAYGDTVERVGTIAGDSGASKQGDFVVTLREGPRFTVEAKDHSRPIAIRGSRGILAALDASMENRAATFGIAVMKEGCGWPKEVGAFNDYDSNKILCCFDPDGDPLVIAYRWARMILLSEDEHDVDETLIRDALDEARGALRELARIQTKMKTIVRSADEVQAIVGLELKRATNAMDRAAAGLAGGP